MFLSQATQYAMGTIMTHKVYGNYSEECLSAIYDETIDLENKLSRFIPESEVSRVNQAAGLEFESVSWTTFDLLSQAIQISKQCQDHFDITVGPLVDLWSRSKQTGDPPTPDSVSAVLPLIDCEDLILDPINLTAGLARPGQAVDLGGIGKGLAGDRVISQFMAFGIQSAYSNLGGNVVTLGGKPDGSPWYVGIQHPRNPEMVIGTIAVCDSAVVTSGDYQRSYIHSAEHEFHHILDPKTGFPCKSEYTSVTVVTKSALIADALSTALFVAGSERAPGLLKTFPDVEAVFVDREMKVMITPGLEKQYRPAADIDFKILN